MSNVCKACGGPTIELLFSRVCKAECDLAVRGEAVTSAEPFRPEYTTYRTTNSGTPSYYSVKYQNPVVSVLPPVPAVPHPLGISSVPANAIGPGVTSRTWTKAYPFAVYSYPNDLAHARNRFVHSCVTHFNNVGVCTLFHTPRIVSLEGIAIVGPLGLISPQQIHEVTLRQDCVQIYCDPPGASMEASMEAYIFYFV